MKCIAVGAEHTQLNFIWCELTTFDGYGPKKLRAAKSVPAATQVFRNEFEVWRPARPARCYPSSSAISGTAA